LTFKTHTDTEWQTTIPLAERHALAEACQRAAEQLENGSGVPIVNEYLRTAIARQPTSGQWAEEINTMLQQAADENPKDYARNLKSLAEKLRSYFP
jgi:hypothetical protein